MMFMRRLCMMSRFRGRLIFFQEVVDERLEGLRVKSGEFLPVMLRVFERQEIGEVFRKFSRSSPISNDARK
jgi:hypothetical protein